MLFLLACSGPPDAARSGVDLDVEDVAVLTAEQQLQALDSIGRVIGDLTIEEGDTALVVAPMVRRDAGGFLVADAKESQVRRYDLSGRLLHTLGRRGGGPGEFEAPVAAVRLADGDLVVADLTGRITVFDAHTDSIVRSFRPPVSPIYGMLVGADGELLILGEGQRERRGELIHVWVPAADSLGPSYFRTPGDANIRKLASGYGWLAADQRADSLLAVFSLVDTVFVLTRAGAIADRIPLPSRIYRPITPAPSGKVPPQARRAWSATLVRLTDVFWLPDNTILVQMHQRVDGEDRYRLLHMTRDGRSLHELVDSPRLLTTRSDTLIFVHPSAAVPNRWLTLALDAVQ